MYYGIEETAAVVQSVAATVLSISEYPDTAFLRGRTTGSHKVHRGPCPWFKDYLSPTPVYPPHRFREVFRITLDIYQEFHDELVEEEPLLRQMKDAFGLPGHTSHQKLLMTFRRFAAGLSFRQMDYMARISV